MVLCPHLPHRNTSTQTMRFVALFFIWSFPDRFISFLQMGHFITNACPAIGINLLAHGPGWPKNDLVGGGEISRLPRTRKKMLICDDKNISWVARKRMASRSRRTGDLGAYRFTHLVRGADMDEVSHCTLSSWQWASGWRQRLSFARGCRNALGILAKQAVNEDSNFDS